jgi:vesicle-fusing ATPase
MEKSGAFDAQEIAQALESVGGLADDGRLSVGIKKELTLGTMISELKEL